MIVEMENYKFEVKRVTHLKTIDTITSCTLLSYIFLGIVLLLLSDAIFGFKYQQRKVFLLLSNRNP